jgi:hypothetical protein
MNCLALTSIAPEIIRELLRGKARTIELQSTPNVITLAGLEPGAVVFMTSENLEDLTPGDTGIIVELLSISVTMKRIMEFTQGLHYEERERMSARVKVRCIGSSTVKNVSQETLIRPISVEVVKSACYHAL